MILHFVIIEILAVVALALGSILASHAVFWCLGRFESFADRATKQGAGEPRMGDCDRDR